MNGITVSYFNKVVLSNKKNLYKSIKLNVSPLYFNKNDLFSIDPSSSHYKINRKINTSVLSNIPVNFCSVGFRKGCSYLDLFEPHLKSEYFLRLDIKKFFHSFPEEEIKKTLKSIFPESKNKDIYSPYQIALNTLTYLVPDSHKNESIRGKRILPMGFPSSPALSNIIFRRIDILIQKECERYGVKYTRYADDMLFSSSSSLIHKDKFYSEISYYISLLGLKINSNKTIKSRYVISLNGYTIDTTFLKLGFLKNSENNKGDFRLSNKILKKYDKLRHLLNVGERPENILIKIYGEDYRKIKFKYSSKKVEFTNRYIYDQLRNKFIGTRSYLISVLKFNEKYNCMNDKSRERISKTIDVLEIYLKS